MGALGWVGFAALWAWQLLVFVPGDWFVGVIAIAVTVVLFAGLAPAWVHWNRNIYRRRHRRTSAIKRSVQLDHDTLGRTVVLGPGVNVTDREIVVTADSQANVKHYDAPVRPQEKGRRHEHGRSRRRRHGAQRARRPARRA
jgi:hypothetical protein